MGRPFVRSCAIAFVLLTAAWRATAATPEEKQAQAHYTAGKKAFEEGDVKAAIDELKASIAAKPTVRACLMLGNCYLKLGQLDDARAAFQKVLEIDPHSSKRKAVEQNIRDLDTLAKTRF